jgi:hypothetical protein
LVARRTPEETVVPPLYVLAFERVTVPEPVLAKAREPEVFWITPEKELVWLLSPTVSV